MADGFAGLADCLELVAGLGWVVLFFAGVVVVADGAGCELVVMGGA